MTRPADSDIIARLEKTARRRAAIFGAVLPLFVVGFWVVGTLVAPPRPGEVPAFLANFGVVLALASSPGVAAFLLVGRMLRPLRPLLPFVEDARLAWGGVLVVLRNGAVLQSRSGFLVCLMGFRADGLVLHPSAAEALRWTGPRSVFSFRPLGAFRGRRGPPVAEAEWDDLRKGMGATLGVGGVRRRATPAPDPVAPHWLVGVSFAFLTFLPWAAMPTDRVVREMTALEAFLPRALRSYAPEVGARGPPPQL